ncbi:Cytochrome c1 precursor [Candidatus Hodgkinia cicadicola]|nr:Cytochrome c1 precursor [Candidatus Hodgkinia cicadicola]
MLLAKRGLGLNAASARRGFEVYRQVCSRCHSLGLFKLEDLKHLGYSKAQILRLANGRRISERFELPYLSKAQAKAFNNGVVPPDLSLIVKRKNSDYVKNVLFGYARVYTNMLARDDDYYYYYYYNYGFDSGVTLMPPVLVDGALKYVSRARTNNLVQYVLDVSEFLAWVSEPWANFRGWLMLPAVSIFSLICGLIYSTLRRSNLESV